LDSYRLLEDLNIDPSDTDLVRAVSRQLEDLEAYGLLARTSLRLEVGWMIDASRQSDLASDLINQFREDCTIRGMSPESTRRCISSLRIYARFLASRQLDLLSADKNVLKSFLEYLRRERSVSQKTIENHFCALSAFYDFLEYEEHIPRNPIHSVRKRYPRRYKDNDDGQVRTLISVDVMAQQRPE